MDPRSVASEEITDVFQKYPHIGAVLPAVGYHASQLQSLQATINAVDADVVVSATPCDISALIKIEKPVVRARYEFTEVGEPKLSDLIDTFLRKMQKV
jgi:predicted GTPase